MMKSRAGGTSTLVGASCLTPPGATAVVSKFQDAGNPQLEWAATCTLLWQDGRVVAAFNMLMPLPVSMDYYRHCQLLIVQLLACLAWRDFSFNMVSTW